MEKVKNDNDVNEFKGYLASHGIKQIELANALKLAPANINLRVQRKRDWKLTEIKTLHEELGIPYEVFFD